MSETEIADRLAQLERMLTELIGSNADLSETIHERNVLVAAQGKDLSTIKTSLGAFVPWSRFRTFVITIGIAGLMVAGTLATALSLNHRTTCGVRGVLLLAQSSVLARPEPTDEESVSRRDGALDFYDESLDKLKILWPCAGERPVTPPTSRE